MLSARLGPRVHEWGPELIRSQPRKGGAWAVGVATPLAPLTAASPGLPRSTIISLPEPVPRPEPFRKKEVVEILSHKKAYNTCEGQRIPRAAGGREWPP